MEVRLPFFAMACTALTVYTSAFVCEAVRSGINSVPLGQAEAARAIGLTFGQTMRAVIMPQAVRAVVPPLASVIIALAKNTSVAAAFGLLEATARMRFFTNRNADDRALIFVTFAVGYIIIVELLAAGALSWSGAGRWPDELRPVRHPGTGPARGTASTPWSPRWSLLGVAGLVLLRMSATGQLDYAKWEPFVTPVYIEALAEAC